MRCSVSSRDETPRRELKIRRAAEYFWRRSRCFNWWWSTVSNAWYYSSNKRILEGEVKDAKLSSLHLISKHSLNINFLCIFFMNYQWLRSGVNLVNSHEKKTNNIENWIKIRNHKPSSTKAFKKSLKKYLINWEVVPANGKRDHFHIQRTGSWSGDHRSLSFH